MKNRKSLFTLFFLLSISSLSAQNQEFYRDIYLASPRMNGPDVTQVQQRLLDLGYAEVGTVDGWFGPNSEIAITIFQNRFSLIDDGVVTADVWQLLFNPNIFLINDITTQIDHLDKIDMDRSDFDFNFEILHEDGPGYPVGYRISAYTNTNDSLVKFIIRVIGDGSGFTYTTYFDEDEIILISNIHWGLNPFSLENEIRWNANYYFQDGELLAEQSILSNEWKFGAELASTDELKIIMDVIKISMETYQANKN